MRTILTVFNGYLNRGGEDEVFENESSLLERYGHNVIKYHVVADREEILNDLKHRAQIAVQSVWSRPAARDFHALLTQHQPDIVHFHNTFPLLSPSVIVKANTLGYPVVHTLHNYRLICPNALLFRDEKICEDCVGRTLPVPGIAHACYRDSRLETAVVASIISAHRLLRTWNKRVDRYIALTEFARRKFIAGGISPHIIDVKPNFVDEPPPKLTARDENLLFVGRLSVEKGINTLLNAQFGQDLQLRIAGTGPLEREVRRVAKENPRLEILGRLSKQEIRDEMLRARALVFPSEWYEGFPMTIVEAFARALPVIASRHGSVSEIIHDGVTGLLFTPGDSDDLAAKMRWAIQHPEAMRKMGKNARNEFEQKYAPARNYELLMSIYQKAIAQRSLLQG